MKILDIDDEDIDSLIERGGLKPETLARRKYILDAFQKFVAEKSLDFEEVKKNFDELEKLVVKYLEGYRVEDKKNKGNFIRPKDNYLTFLKSNLVVALENLTGFHFDKSRKFSQTIKGIRREIKADGRGETDHKAEIPDETLDAILSLGAILVRILEARLVKDSDAYNKAINELPNSYKHEWHILLRLVVQFVVTMYDCRRAKEGLELLTKTHFEIAESKGLKFFKKVGIFSEISKNSDFETFSYCYYFSGQR